MTQRWFCKTHGQVPGEEIRTVIKHGASGHAEYMTTGHVCGAVARRAPFNHAEAA